LLATKFDLVDSLMLEQTENESKITAMAEDQDRLLGWSVEDHLAFDIGFALPRAPVRGLRRSLTDEDRRTIARPIVQHLRLCGWEFRLGQVGHGTGRGGR
jgi:hypothetical protein